MTSHTGRERLQLGQFTLTANAQGHRLSAERTGRSVVVPTASMAAPQAHARSPATRARNACEVIMVPNRIASLSRIVRCVTSYPGRRVIPALDARDRGVLPASGGRQTASAAADGERAPPTGAASP